MGFRRFVARRGRCSTIYCDNGTNFVGAANLLHGLDWNEILRHGALNAIDWKFNPQQLHGGESKEAHLGGDLKGDYYQVGGTLVVKKGGEKVLLNHKQESLADHIDSKEVLKCLNIS
ncbi:hypothetical protein AVEN_234476-1 [Araneus ventricosus]|uniref:Uncharacterized protein n=1 Tax=Araneus ventricosus TaxID=182803 RepID=A0A4Y2A8U0_ARAVE|nr:hypothetical protein AVEN_234476-1 [Araneus ventricosus]